MYVNDRRTGSDTGMVTQVGSRIAVFAQWFLFLGSLSYGLTFAFLWYGGSYKPGREVSAFWISIATILFPAVVHCVLAVGLRYRLNVARIATMVWLCLETIAGFVLSPGIPPWSLPFGPLPAAYPLYTIVSIVTHKQVAMSIGWVVSVYAIGVAGAIYVVVSLASSRVRPLFINKLCIF